MSKQDGTVDRLVLVAGDGRVAERYNIVLVAEGYRASEAATFEADALAIANTILAAPPFADHAAAINVFRLDVSSTESGADRHGAMVATYFDAAFAEDPPRLLLVDAELVAATVQAALTDGANGAHAHKMIVVVNTPFDGGSGGIDGGVAVASRAIGARTVLHELGHLFGLLDEYDSTTGPDTLSSWPPPPPPPPGPPLPTAVAPNLAMSADRADLPWADLVAAATPLPTDGMPGTTWSTVGAFVVDHGGGTDYRPMKRCRMRFSVTSEFCTVCARHIEEALKSAT